MHISAAARTKVPRTLSADVTRPASAWPAGIRHSESSQSIEFRLRAEADEVRADHHRAARQAVGPYAAGDDQPRAADRVGGEHATERGCPAADPEHREGDGDDHERVAHGRAVRASQSSRNGRSVRGPKRPRAMA
jgi:hypothetical protein